MATASVAAGPCRRPGWDPPPRFGRRRALPLLVVGLAVALRAPFFGTVLGIDEGGDAAVAQHWAATHGSLYGGSWLDRPPLLVALFRLAVTGGAAGVRILGGVAACALALLVAALARELGGRRAGLAAAVIAAVLASSPALGSVVTPAELLAAVPSTASVFCLLTGARRADARRLAAAGALAVTAVLVKQSFLDAGFAGAVFLLVDGRRLRWWAAYAAGAAAVLLAVVVWAAAAHVRLGALVYAVFGFRIAALHALSGSSIPLQDRLAGLGHPFLFSGLAPASALAAAGVTSLRRDRPAMVILLAWLAAGIAGVLGGGSYWPHYLIELVPVTAVGAGVALARIGARDHALHPRRRFGAAIAGVVAFAVAAAVVGGLSVQAHPPRQAVLDVGRWLRRHAHRGDTQWVAYARADVAFYSGLTSPYPYAWSLMVRAHPGARRDLLRLLASPRRPTWIVEWQPFTRWGLDPDGAIRRDVHAAYRRVAVVDGHVILRRVSAA